MHLKSPLTWKRIIATTLTAGLAITGAAILAAPAASAAPAATPPAPTQNVDATLKFTCNIFVGVSKPVGTPTFTNQPISSETEFSLPTTVNPGEKIPATKVTIVNDFTGLIQDAHAIGATEASGGSPDLTSTYLVNNKSISVPINNVIAPLSDIPAGDPTADPSVKWFDTATGTNAALTVPQDASGDIIVDGPTKFTIESNLFATASSKPEPTVLTCTAVQGSSLQLARITVEPAGSQDIDVSSTYVCDTYSNPAAVPHGAPAAGTVSPANPVPVEIKATLPSVVTPGSTIPATDLSLSWQVPGILAGLLVIEGSLGLSQQTSTLPDAALGVRINGQTSTSSITNLASPLTPPPAAAPVIENAVGTTSAIAVPADADGNITISAPERFEIDLSDVATAGTSQTNYALECAAPDDTDLTLATIAVTRPPAHATLVAASPRSSVFGAPVTVPVTANAPAATTPAQAKPGGTQNVDTIKVYSCNYWKNATSVPTDGTNPFPTNQISQVELTTTLPASVNPGDTIAPTGFALTWSTSTSSLGTNTVPASVSSIDQVTVPDAALGVDLAGQTSSSPISGLGTTTPIPTPTTNPWLVPTQGSTAAITVPSSATSDLDIQAPQTFSILFTAEPADPSTGTPVPWAAQCTTSDPLYLASINVLRPLAPITHPQPTGKVLIMRGSKGVAQGTLSKGKANVVIPGTALPVGKNTLTVKYTGDSNTLDAPSKTITVVKTKASPTLDVHVTPGRLAAGAIFPTVNVKLTGPGSAKGGKITITAGSVHKTANLLFDGTQSVQLPPFATAGRKLIKVAYAGNANFVAKTVTVGLNVTKTKLGKFVVKVKPGKIVAKKTRATLLITLGAPDKLNHGMVTVKLAGRVIAKKVVAGTGKITLPKFPSAGRKLLKLTFTGNASVVAKTVTHAVKVTKRR